MKYHWWICIPAAILRLPIKSIKDYYFLLIGITDCTLSLFPSLHPSLFIKNMQFLIIYLVHEHFISKFYSASIHWKCKMGWKSEKRANHWRLHCYNCYTCWIFSFRELINRNWDFKSVFHIQMFHSALSVLHILIWHTYHASGMHNNGENSAWTAACYL